MKVHARGQLRHMFHGEYNAAIVLQFDGKIEAAKALITLSAKNDGWKLHPKSDAVLQWVGPSAPLDAIMDTLESFGANRKKIASIAKSIDYGEPFTCDIEV